MKKPNGTVVLCLLCLSAAPLRAGIEIVFSSGSAREVRTSEGENPAAPPPAPPLGEFVVAWPVVDLRRDLHPVDAAAAARRPYAVDPLQETQLLYGEGVWVFEERGPWVRVEASEQPEFTHANRWQGYPGWVPREALELRHPGTSPNGMVVARYARVREKPSVWSRGNVELPLGSRLYVVYHKKGWSRVAGVRGESGWMRSEEIHYAAQMPRRESDVRRAVLRTAALFRGEPYYWGGRAGHRARDRSAPSGVDCSGLVNLSYRAAGLEVPRDAHEQFLASRALARGADLQPGDLVFLAKADKPERVIHVMIFTGGETLIEAVHEFNVVRRVSFAKKLGRRRAALAAGDSAQGYEVRFGRLIPG